MKKSMNLFGKKKVRRRQREDDFVDFDERYDEEYEDGYDDEDYPDEEFEEEYGDEVDDRYEDEEYPEDDRYEDEEEYPEDNRYEDEEEYPEDDRYEDEEEYSDRDYQDEEDYDTDYLPDVSDRIEESNKPSRGVVLPFKETYPPRNDSDELYEDVEDENYSEDEEDYDRDYEADDDYDYSDEDDYDRDVDDDYDRDVDDEYEDEYDRGYERERSSRLDRGSRSDRGGRGSRRGRDRDRGGESVGAKILQFIRNTSVAERASAVVALLLIVGGIATLMFYIKAKNYAAEVGSFAEVGADLQIDGAVGSSGLLAIADAEMARAMAAGLVEEIEEEEEEVVPDTASNVTIKMTLTSIKSDMKIKFINSETKKLVANVPFVVSVVTPDGTKISYDDHDRDGIIYKKDLTAGKYKITPEALSSEYDSYKLDTSTQTLTVKDTVEMKAVDVSNEIKKESQINAAKEDTAVQTQVESVLNDTVEWVDSNQNSSTSSDGKYKYEVIDKDDIPNPSSSAMLTIGSVKRMAAARGRAKEPNPDEAANSNSTEASTEGSTETPVDPSTGGTTTDSSAGGTTDSSSGSTTTESAQPKDMSVSLTESNIKVGQTTTINVSGPSSYDSSSDNESVATVSGSTVTAKGVGTAKIKISASGYNDAYVTVTVTEADKKTMTLSTTSLAIKMGATGKITVSSGPSSFNVKSSDEKIAKVASDGTITPVAEGSATITFSADGYNDATATVTVGKADKKDMTLSVKELTIAVNEKGKITITSGPSTFSVKSSDEKIAKVASDGTITGIAEGKATVTFSADGYNDAAAAITVTKTGTKTLTMNVSKVTLVQGQTFKISPKDTSLTVTYKSDNTDIATISGVTITGVKEGKTTITCSCTGYADTKIEVTVVSKTTVLKDKNGNVVYVKDADGKYVEATYNDYYNGKTFYLKKENDGVRQGWWTIDGKTYYYTKNGDKVTGEQVIKGARYTFGSDGALSSSSGTMGIDVSKWNGNINWTSVKNAGVNYAIIRCGYRGSSAGALIEDPKFKANIQGAQAAGIRVGVYFFSQAVNEVEAVEEASMCINLCKGYNLSFPVYIDVEASNGRGDQISASQRTANVKAFCGTIQSAGYRAGVYSNKTWFTKYMNASSLTSYKIWLAQYAANVTYTATRYDMWQYTSKGSISGISGNVDMNINYN